MQRNLFWFGLDKSASRPLLIPALTASLVGIGLFCLVKYTNVYILTLVLLVLLLFLLFLIVSVYSMKRSKDTLAALVFCLFLTLYMSATLLGSWRVILSEGFSEVDYNVSTEVTIKECNQRFDGSCEIIGSDAYGKVLIYLNDVSHSTEVKTGDIYLITGKAVSPNENTNPGQFDYRDYLMKKGILRIIYADSFKLSGSADNFICRSADLFRSKVFDLRLSLYHRISNLTEPENVGLAAAILLGDRSELTDDTYREFKLTNSAHLLACSGTHFSAFLIFISMLIEQIPIKHKYKRSLYMILCLCIGLLTGFSKSVTRASVMSINSISDRDTISGLALASIILIVADPFCVLDLGYQMSFVIVLTVVLMRDKFDKSDCLPASARMMCIAFIASFPFMTVSDYYLSPDILLSQFISNSILTLICVIFLPLFALSFVFVPFFWPVDFLFTLLRHIVGTFSEYALLSFNIGKIYYPCLIVAFMAILVSLMPRCEIKKLLKSVMGLVLALTVGLACGEYLIRPINTIVFADVGQGDCILIITEKYNVMIDGGVYDKGKEVLVPLLDYYGIDKLDFAVISHPDSDHGGGIAYLYNVGRVKALISCCDNNEQFMELGFTNYPNIEVLRAKDYIRVADDTVINVVSPNVAESGDNDDSLVLELRSETTDILLTGDISGDKERELIESQKLTQTDILKVAHHGSRFSTTNEFLDAVKPTHAIISVGRYNSYGHPSPETVQRLELHKVEIENTSIEGAIIVDVYSDRYKLYGYL